MMDTYRSMEQKKGSEIGQHKWSQLIVGKGAKEISGERVVFFHKGY